ncbi:MAG: ATP-binding protein [Paramuribaculum sp.]|nr:ATP-binding protein [Paramuribaculum sp.]
MIHRIISAKLKDLSTKYPIVTLTGPRQSGKSTLLKNEFCDYTYLSLENPDIKEFALSDPNGFIKTYPDKVIIDEIQKVPNLLSYIQTHTDNVNETGMYLLAGSQNFLLLDSISQSLAGRTAILKLLPFSRLELKDAGLLNASTDDQIYKGFYPRLYDKDIAPEDYYPYYIQTYVERDVRDVLRISDLNKFVKFIRLCAGRIGQILNLSSLANETGITANTADAWLSVLEASYICYRLAPNFTNYNKRVVKSPKLYFYATGLACSLLGLSSADQVSAFYMRGSLFENLVINQFIKDAYNNGKQPDLTYWRDSQGNEIDLIATNGLEMNAYEIKIGQTYSTDYFKGLDKWGKLSGTPVNHLNVIYNGDTELNTSKGKLLSFANLF